MDPAIVDNDPLETLASLMFDLLTHPSGFNDILSILAQPTQALESTRKILFDEYTYFRYFAVSYQARQHIIEESVYGELMRRLSGRIKSWFDSKPVLNDSWGSHERFLQNASKRDELNTIRLLPADPQNTGGPGNSEFALVSFMVTLKELNPQLRMEPGFIPTKMTILIRDEFESIAWQMRKAFQSLEPVFGKGLELVTVPTTHNGEEEKATANPDLFEFTAWIEEDEGYRALYAGALGGKTAGKCVLCGGSAWDGNEVAALANDVLFHRLCYERVLCEVPLLTGEREARAFHKEHPSHLPYLRLVHTCWPVCPPDWESRKKDILRRAGGHCERCGLEDDLEVCHIKPLAKGGSNSYDNLAAACRLCREAFKA